VFERLASLEDEYISLEVSLSDPDVVSDQSALRRVSKRYKDLTPVVECLRAHRERSADAQAARELLVDASDADRQMLLGKHDERLRNHQAPAAGAAVFARSPPTGRRVLFIDDMIPLRRLGSGFVRSNDLINAMAALGYAVTVFPMNLTRFGLATIHADMPDVVEVMHDRSSETLATFLAERPDYYDVIWIARTHNLDRVGPLLERLVTDSNKPPQIVLDTEAITALRDAQYSMLSGDPSFDVDTALLREFANLHLSQNVVAVNSFEAAKLRTLGPANVTVIGHLRELRPTPRGFEQRAGMLFLGAIHEVGSPNHDALEWFVREVLPFVEQALGWETRLTVAGYVSPDVSLATYRDHPRITLRGPVEELEPLYGAHRIFVAPTRYAAGVPYKLHEAASYGLPVIATDLLCRQLGWDNGRDIIAVDPADPAGFARQIVALYRDAALWQSLRDHALERARTENARIDYEAAVRQVLDQHRE